MYLRQGDIVYVVEECDDGWFVGKLMLGPIGYTVGRLYCTVGRVKPFFFAAFLSFFHSVAMEMLNINPEGLKGFMQQISADKKSSGCLSYHE